ncbi:uncharacterized protein SOCEGT47_020900 [Sorangium cellulosum]|uniref:Secreted protein n=1 Tax=Sorangium cellulosum TaxID=56 RepID=A0A4P2PXP9_SORCE|nr:hypothetical protein [Sorangium cellulosum]AUX21604.1 uncharacterized protein SOCEGT47_020900 [Sorangium cellulosum]
MRNVLPVSLAARAVPLLLVSVLSASCSRNPPERPGGGGAGGHPATGGAGGHPATSGATQGSTHGSGTAGEAATDAGVPVDAGPDVAAPPGDSAWKAAGWLDGCQVDVADEPKKALPPLRWEPCPGGAPGCTSLAVDWDHDKYPRTASPSVVRWGDGYRVGLVLQRLGDQRAGVYDADGTPLAAWRSKDYCLLTVPEVGHERVWLGAQRVGVDAIASAYLVSGYDELASASQPIPVDVSNRGLTASDDTLVLSGPDVGAITIYDRISNKAREFGPRSGDGAPSIDRMHPVGDSAVGLAFFEDRTTEGWIWNRKAHSIEPLHRAESPRILVDFTSDGQTLVWLEASPVSDDGLHGPSTLWTSPFAAAKADLAPTPRRPGPVIGYPISAVGEGFYAVYAIGEKAIHVYRLSDAHHWSFKTPPEVFDLQDIAHVDSREVWVWVRGGIVRQAISELGAGDPAP